MIDQTCEPKSSFSKEVLMTSSATEFEEDYISIFPLNKVIARS